MRCTLLLAAVAGTLAAARRICAGAGRKARSRARPEDRQRGLHRVPRAQRKQRGARKSEHRGTAGRVYHPATRSLQVGTARESRHAGDGGHASTRRDEGARHLLLPAETERPGGEGRDARHGGTEALPRRRQQRRASPRAPPVTRRTARASRKNYPRLAGQHADYTYAQLKAFKAGERGADKDGKDVNGTIMVTVAARMSDAQMKAVAEYASGLR